MINSKEISTIKEAIFHYPYLTISSRIRKINDYSQLGAEELFHRNKKTTLVFALVNGGSTFIKMFFLKRGFLDRKEGFILALLSGFSSALKYLKLWSLWRVK